MTLSASTGQRLAPLDMLARLVAFDTVSHKSNLELIAFVEDYLAGWGVSSIRIPNATGDKAALFATIGPQDRAASCFGAYRRGAGGGPGLEPRPVHAAYR